MKDSRRHGIEEKEKLGMDRTQSKQTAAGISNRSPTQEDQQQKRLPPSGQAKKHSSGEEQ